MSAATIVALPSGQKASNNVPSLQPSSSSDVTKSAANNNNSPKNATTEAPTGQSYLQARDEGLLGDVLAELDRERTKRAELEAKIRQLEEEVSRKQQQQQDKAVVSSNNAVPQSQHSYIALQTESLGYLQLLDALTMDRPAFAAALANDNQAMNANSSALHLRKPTQNVSKTLPLHVVRLLEILPWDERTQPHLFSQECVYEWQIQSSQKTWLKTLRQFPTFFKTLPIVLPQPGKTVQERSSTWSRPPQQGVLTNVDVNQILNIDKGYPLPQDGGSWQWIGGWRIEKRPNETDDQGWSYSYNPQITGDNHNYRDQLEIPPKGAPNLMHRRRKWTRTRILVDYPHASESTRQYLKVLADKVASQLSVEKISEQLVRTKMNLTTLEQDHLTLKEVTDRRVRNLTQDLEKSQLQLKKKEELLASYEKGDGGNVTKTKAKDQVKEIGSAVSQWVSDTVTKTRQKQTNANNESNKQGNNDSAHDGNTIDSEEEAPESEDPTPATISGTTVPLPALAEAPLIAASGSTAAGGTKQLIDWDKVRGGGLNVFDKIKQTGDQGISKMKQRGGISSWLHKSSTTQSSTETLDAAAPALNLEPSSSSIHN